jgi:cysteine-rich repeat protein
MAPVRFVTACLLLLGCRHDEAVFTCKDSSQCHFEGAEGLCETSGVCSFPDRTCTGGRRYGAQSGEQIANTCVPARSCGDGIIQRGEDCDDGNRVNNDGCTNGCVRCGPSDGNARTTWEKSSSCYTRHDDPKDWPAAAEACGAGGGHLLATGTGSEQEAVGSEILLPAPATYWIGLSDRSEEGTFAWVTREPIFTRNWRKDEPAATTSDHDCATLSPKLSGPGFDWVVRPCGEKQRYVCEFPPWQVNPRDRHAYKIIYRPLTWAQAVEVCKKFAGHLATLTSSEEHDFVTQRFFGRYWLGASDLQKEGIFAWITGEGWHYKNFADTEPDNYDGKHNCLDMADERRWHDQDCSHMQPALCELD